MRRRWRALLAALALAGVTALVFVSSRALLAAPPEPAPPPTEAVSSTGIVLGRSGNDARTFVGPAYDTALVSEPTATATQSKLWFNDGSWWGVLAGPDSQWRIHQLDGASQSWIDTGVLVDERATSSADVLWDGQRLYVVTGGSRSSSRDALRLLRFGYDPAARRHILDEDFPATVKERGAREFTLDRDTTGQLWVAFVDEGTPFVTHSLGDDDEWVEPFTPPVPGVSATTDSVAILASAGRIRVAWSNTDDGFLHVAEHTDGASSATWTETSTPLPGLRTGDDHLHVAAFASDPRGRMFAAVKTGTPVGSSLDRVSPLVSLLVLDGAGQWETHVFGQVGDDHTRPTLLIDEERGVLHLFATAPTGGGTIYRKQSPIDQIAFASGSGAPFVTSFDHPRINNGTSTKQSVSSATGLVLLASDDETGRYLHGTQSLGEER